MKVIVLSDLHGYLPEIITEFNLMLICGDICPVWNHSVSYQESWLKKEFKAWVNNLPYRDDFSRVVFIAGNHDFYFERVPERDIHKFLYTIDYRLIYLENSVYYCMDLTAENPKEISIFGTPYCTQFGNWAFMRSSDYLKEKFSEIPEDIDIIISHDPPYGMNGLGSITEGHQKGVECGSKELKEAVERCKPKYLFCGHIHSGNHIFSRCIFPDSDKEMWSANVSIMDEYYTPVHKPLIFDI